MASGGRGITSQQQLRKQEEEEGENYAFDSGANRENGTREPPRELGGERREEREEEKNLLHLPGK